MRSVLRRFTAWLNARLNIVATGDENDYYIWADIRLDQLAEEARSKKEKT